MKYRNYCRLLLEGVEDPYSHDRQRRIIFSNELEQHRNNLTLMFYDKLDNVVKGAHDMENTQGLQIVSSVDKLQQRLASNRMCIPKLTLCHVIYVVKDLRKLMWGPHLLFDTFTQDSIHSISQKKQV